MMKLQVMQYGEPNVAFMCNGLSGELHHPVPNLSRNKCSGSVFLFIDGFGAGHAFHAVLYRNHPGDHIGSYSGLCGS